MMEKSDLQMCGIIRDEHAVLPSGFRGILSSNVDVFFRGLASFKVFI